MSADHSHVGVIGFGAMGGGIAQVVAASGRKVTVLEIDDKRIAEGQAKVEAFLRVGVDRGKMTATDAAAIMSRITGTTEIADFGDTSLVIEAATEERQLKRALLTRLDTVVPASTIIATNTSALSVSDLASAVSAPQRFAGLHYFNPAPLMPIVEVIRGMDTAESTIESLVSFSLSTAKTPVVVADGPGFLVNRLLMPYLNDAITVLDEGLATAADIDKAVRLGLGHKQGPFELLDLVGLDVHRHSTSNAYEASLNPTFAPPPLLSRMVAAGRLGRKTRRGFYESGDQ